MASLYAVNVYLPFLRTTDSRIAATGLLRVRLPMEIIRSALKSKSTRRARRRRQRLAERLKRNALSRAALVIEEAERLIKGVDSL